MIIGVTSYLLTGYVETQSLDQSYQHTGQGFSNLSVRTDQVFCSVVFVGDFLIFWLLMKKVQVSIDAWLWLETWNKYSNCSVLLLNLESVLGPWNKVRGICNCWREVSFFQLKIAEIYIALIYATYKKLNKPLTNICHLKGKN